MLGGGGSPRSGGKNASRASGDTTRDTVSLARFSLAKAAIKKDEFAISNVLDSASCRVTVAAFEERLGARVIPGYKILALAALAGLLLLLPGCRSKTVASGPQYIMLVYNNGNCEQNGGTGIIDVYANQPVIYQGATAQTEFQIQFTSCPLTAENCPVNSPNGSSVNVGVPLPSATGSTFMYSNMKIDNEPCNGAQAMGLRVRPAP